MSYGLGSHFQNSQSHSVLKIVYPTEDSNCTHRDVFIKGFPSLPINLELQQTGGQLPALALLLQGNCKSFFFRNAALMANP